MEKGLYNARGRSENKFRRCRNRGALSLLTRCPILDRSARYWTGVPRLPWYSDLGDDPGRERDTDPDTLTAQRFILMQCPCSNTSLVCHPEVVLR